MSRYPAPASFAFRLLATTFIAILCGCSQDSAVDSGATTNDPVAVESSVTTSDPPPSTTDTVEVPEFDTAPPLEVETNEYESADTCLSLIHI